MKTLKTRKDISNLSPGDLLIIDKKTYVVKSNNRNTLECTYCYDQCVPKEFPMFEFTEKDLLHKAKIWE